MPPTAKDQQLRRERLYELLRSGAGQTQRALVDALLTSGIPATQSSVSRDLRELGAVKTRAGYVLPAAANDDSDDEIRAVADLVRNIQAAGPNLLVVRTGAGAAQRVALALDRSSWPEIVGNIGGDDTVFVATASLAQQKRLLSRLNIIRQA
ncbi:MAG: arginine repressor [Pseudomonadota bacterium]